MPLSSSELHQLAQQAADGHSEAAVALACLVHLSTDRLAAHGSLPTEADAARMAQQAAIVMEMLERYLPEARQLARGEGRGLVAEAEVRV